MSAFPVPVPCSCPAAGPSCAALCPVCGRSVPRGGSLVGTFVTLCACPAAGLLVPACSLRAAAPLGPGSSGLPVLLAPRGVR